MAFSPKIVLGGSCSQHVVSIGPFSNTFHWNPLFTSNPQVKILGGIVPNMHIPEGGITVPTSLIGQVGQSLIDINPLYVN